MSRRGRSGARQNPLPPERSSAEPTSGGQLQLTRTQLEYHEGPLPHPDALARYNEIIPDGANRILAMAEKQQDHRMFLEKKVISGDVNRANSGLAAGFIVALAFLAASVYLVVNDHAVSGTIIGATDIIGLVWVFIYGSNRRKEEREHKAGLVPRRR